MPCGKLSSTGEYTVISVNLTATPELPGVAVFFQKNKNARVLRMPYLNEGLKFHHFIQ